MPVNLRPNPDPPEIPEGAGMGRDMPEEMFVTEDHSYLALVACDGSGIIPEAFEEDYKPAQEIMAMIEGV